MYQPGLRVMADTGMGVAEWLRHLGRPNPLPNIQPAVAPANQQKWWQCWCSIRGGKKRKEEKSKKEKV